MKKNLKYLSLILMAVMVVGFSSAMLVSYLSNTVTGSVTVSSPMQITLDCGEVCEFDVYGGETLLVGDTVSKLGSGLTGDMNVAFKISNFDGEGMTVSWRHASGLYDAIELISIYNNTDDSTTYSFVEGFNWDNEAQGFYEEGDFIIEFAPAIENKVYSMSAVIVPVPVA